jgi:hypothetical protein
VSLSAKIAIVAGLCLAVAPAQAYCDYPDAGGAPVVRAAALSFMQMPRFSPEGGLATMRVADQGDRLSDGSAATGSRCLTNYGSKVLPLGAAPLGNACGFRLPDGSFVEGEVAG